MTTQPVYFIIKLECSATVILKLQFFRIKRKIWSKRNCKYQLLKIAIANFNIDIQNLFVLKSLKYESCQLVFGKAIYSPRFQPIYCIIMHADWLTEWGMLRACPHFLIEHTHTYCLRVHTTHTHTHTLSLSLSLDLSLDLSLSLSGEQGVHTLFIGQREREREGERER